MFGPLAVDIFLSLDRDPCTTSATSAEEDPVGSPIELRLPAKYFGVVSWLTKGMWGYQV